MGNETRGTIASQGLRLEVRVAGQQVFASLTDPAAGAVVADGEYWYRAEREDGDSTLVARRLGSPTLRVKADSLEATGTLAGLQLTHLFKAPAGSSAVEEHVTIRNDGSEIAGLTRFSAGMTRLVTDHLGIVFPELRADRLAAIPYRNRVDLSITDLLERQGWEHRVARESFTRLTNPGNRGLPFAAAGLRGVGVAAG